MVNYGKSLKLKSDPHFNYCLVMRVVKNNEILNLKSESK